LEVKIMAIHFIIDTIDKLMEDANLIDQLYFAERRDFNLIKLGVCMKLSKK